MDARLTSRLLADGDVAAHSAALQELAALAREHPEERQPIADAVCRYLRESPGPAPAGEQAVAVLAEVARQHPDVGDCPADAAAAAITGTAAAAAGCDAACEHCLDLELDTAVLPDVDFGGCRLGDVSFTDTHFRGDSVFTRTRFASTALFRRSVFEGAASFAGARFNREADFGRTRFRADADFSRVRFQNIAWSDHGVSFADATFAMEAWFWKARFGSAVSFQRCEFGGRVNLIQPTVDLTGARLTADARARGQEWPEGQDWPFGWATSPDLDEDGAARVVLDESLKPYPRHLADPAPDPDPEVRLASLRILGELGDADADLRERIADTVCAYLRTPPAFDVTIDVFDPAPTQFAELRARGEQGRATTNSGRRRQG